jgi:hypothetical protein
MATLRQQPEPYKETIIRYRVVGEEEDSGATDADQSQGVGVVTAEPSHRPGPD